MPLALTDNLNFGNPERPEIMGQLVGCIRGIGEACRALDFPVVSGNVSLYNETNGRAILPTPTIGGVGLLDDFRASATLAFKAEGEAILLVGETQGWLGQSLYLREICGREEGAPPPVDLAAERRHGEFVRALIRDGLVTAVHDLSDGGLLVALAEMAMASASAPCSRRRRGVPPPRLLVRRGPGPLCADGERCRRCRGAGRSGRAAIDASRRNRRKGAGRRRREAAADQKSDRALRELAAGLYGSSRLMPPQRPCCRVV